MKIQIGDGSGNEKYRTCSECGRDCEPEPFSVEGEDGGVRIAFSCPEHGLHSVVNPFDSNPKD